MRRKISKRLRKEILKRGGEIISPHWIREKNWPRKQCGFAAIIIYRGWKIYCMGHDELATYRLALETIPSITDGYSTGPVIFDEKIFYAGG